MLLFLIACQSSPKEFISDKEQFIVVPETTTFPFNEEFSYQFSLFDSSNNPISEDGISVDAEMPAHGHGMGQTPEVTHSENTYTATGMLFAMEGDWDIHIYRTTDGSVDQATISVVCCE